MKKMLVLLCLLIIFAMGLFFGLYATRFMKSGSPRILSTSTILKQVQTLSQLVTVKYVIEKVVVLEDVKWYGENRVLFIAHGIVKAGIDLSAIRPQDIQISGKKVVVHLPTAAISDVYLDEKNSQIIERSTGLLRSFDKDLEQNARRQAVDDLRRAAFYGGILKEAEERARAQLSGLFLQSGFDEVELKAQ